ncbi:phage antirepressor [Arthrobacter rhombi]|uniref:phage antirepressor n=1 Tax=Arthrobacter rhombi TaxID=71253 RepID=UPI003FCEF4C8
MNDLQRFEFDGIMVRTIDVDGQPWFVSRDVCTILGLANVAQALVALDEDQKGVITNDTLGGAQQMSIISESGMYQLVLRSRKPEAKPFRRWVTDEVLPTIRRTGSYTTNQTIQATGPDLLALAVLEAQRMIEEKDEQLAIAGPKAEAFDELMDADGLYSMEAAAKALGYGRNILFRQLRRLGVLQGNNLPYQKVMHHFEIKVGTYTNRNGETHPTYTTWVKPSGLQYLRKKLDTAQAAVEQAGLVEL